MPPLAGTMASCRSGGKPPGGAMSVERNGAVSVTMADPSGVHAGSMYNAADDVRRTGSPCPLARVFQSAPPDSSHVTKAIHRPSGEVAGMNSRARTVRVTRRAGRVLLSASHTRPSAEKLTDPDGPAARCCARRACTSPVSTR